jgi:hypothetical protein
MATKIKDTPILEGEDARRFRQRLKVHCLKELTPEEIKAREEERKHRKKCYEQMVSISNGSFY